MCVFVIISCVHPRERRIEQQQVRNRWVEARTKNSEYIRMHDYTVFVSLEHMPVTILMFPARVFFPVGRELDLSSYKHRRIPFSQKYNGFLSFCSEFLFRFSCHSTTMHYSNQFSFILGFIEKLQENQHIQSFSIHRVY